MLYEHQVKMWWMLSKGMIYAEAEYSIPIFIWKNIDSQKFKRKNHVSKKLKAKSNILSVKWVEKQAQTYFVTNSKELANLIAF